MFNTLQIVTKLHFASTLTSISSFQDTKTSLALQTEQSPNYFRSFPRDPKTYIQYGWYLFKPPLCGSLADSTDLLLNWSAGNIGTGRDERLLNWLDLSDE